MGVIVSTSFDAKPVGMFERLEPDLKDIWKSYPLALTQAEEKSCGLREVLPFVQEIDQDARLPSRLAGINETEIDSQLLIAINRTYRHSIDSYFQLLKKATLADCKELHAYKNKFRIREDVPWLWRLISFWGTPFISRQEFQRYTQAERHDWFVRVQTLELQRIARIKCEIEATVPRLQKQLNDLAKTDSKRVKVQTEIEQLQRVYKAVIKQDLRLQHNQTQK